MPSDSRHDYDAANETAGGWRLVEIDPDPGDRQRHLQSVDQRVLGGEIPSDHRSSRTPAPDQLCRAEQEQLQSVVRTEIKWRGEWLRSRRQDRRLVVIANDQRHDRHAGCHAARWPSDNVAANQQSGVVVNVPMVAFRHINYSPVNRLGWDPDRFSRVR
jgi:hypothetical protein